MSWACPLHPEVESERTVGLATGEIWWECARVECSITSRLMETLVMQTVIQMSRSIEHATGVTGTFDEQLERITKLKGQVADARDQLRTMEALAPARSRLMAEVKKLRKILGGTPLVGEAPAITVSSPPPPTARELRERRRMAEEDVRRGRRWTASWKQS